MRIPIREQLAALVLLSTLVGLAVVAVATWVTNHNLVIDLRSTRLEVTASLIATQLSGNLALYERSARGLASRFTLQSALEQYNRGNYTLGAWAIFEEDFRNTSAAQQQLVNLQTRIFARNNVEPEFVGGLANATNPELDITLPYTHPNGAPVRLGDPGLGYPPLLYPNITYRDNSNGHSAAYVNGRELNALSTLLLGPWQINSTFGIFSITVPVINNTSETSIIGYSTLVVNAQLFFDVVNSPIGLDETGTILLIAPASENNRFSPGYSPGFPPPASLDDALVRYALPPNETRYEPKRHLPRDYGHRDPPFRLSSYSAIPEGLENSEDQINKAGSNIDCLNEEGKPVSIGFAVPASEMCQWILVVEQAKAEAWQPIVSLRNILLACVFGTAGGMALLIYPLAHYSSRPIRRLRDATVRSVGATPGSSADELNPDRSTPVLVNGTTVMSSKDGAMSSSDEKRSSKMNWGHFWKGKQAQVDVESTPSALSFRMPSKVEVGKHWIEDELTDLTQTFNEMSDELLAQYSKLEERVRQRTSELEESKKAAEAANESKTLFIANISHELKTPLNGILGMCAVCMQEEDLSKIKRSLGIIYKSGDLLHHLLTDLLTFSKNQVGKYLSLEEKEFRLRDIATQLQAIFQTQASERRTTFLITYHGPRDATGAVRGLDHGDFGPPGTGRVRDMCLWGDIQRILQVTINLISNGLKFTPSGGTVNLRIKCIEKGGRLPLGRTMSDNSISSERRQIQAALESSSQADMNKIRNESVVEPIGVRERHSFTSATSDNQPDPPSDAETLWFEFEVSDNGPGISKQLQNQIFEPFVQGDLRLTKKYGGTGLGLSICVQLAKLMQGDIHLQSNVGEGSTFTLRLPLKLCRIRADSSATSVAHVSMSSVDAPISAAPNQEDDPQTSGGKAFDDTNPRLIGLSQPYFSNANPPMASPTNESPKKENKLKVLVAEDNKVNQEVVLRMLRLEEIFDVHVAKDGQEALDCVKESMEQESPYDLIFMDIMMPNLDGRQSTRLIRQIGYSAPIVALTAFADEVNQKECMDSGMDYFLSKPIKRPALKHVLKTYCAPIQEMDESESKDANGFTNPDPFNNPSAPGEASSNTAESPVVTPRTTVGQE